MAPDHSKKAIGLVPTSSLSHAEAGEATVLGPSGVLHRKLKSRHMQMIAFGMLYSLFCRERLPEQAQRMLAVLLLSNSQTLRHWLTFFHPQAGLSVLDFSSPPEELYMLEVQDP